MWIRNEIDVSLNWSWQLCHVELYIGIAITFCISQFPDFFGYHIFGKKKLVTVAITIQNTTFGHSWKHSTTQYNTIQLGDWLVQYRNTTPTKQLIKNLQYNTAQYNTLLYTLSCLNILCSIKNSENSVHFWNISNLSKLILLNLV